MIAYLDKENNTKVTMSKYVVATTIPMMGEHEDNNNQGKSHCDQDVSNTSN
jgi:hypothetical protein